jgi:GTPase SAR1 family protein
MLAGTILQEKAEEFFQFALTRAANFSTLKSLRAEIEICYGRLHKPMRVAIVGLIKAGKSTLMNALLGEELVSTGTEELTYNINWFRYGENSSLLVHFKDQRPPEKKTLAELESLTCRQEKDCNYLKNIKYIEVFYPNKLLQTFNLLDTPGLASFFEADSLNTIKTLGLNPEYITELTQKEASNADAVLYLFSNSISAYDQDIVKLFQGPVLGNATPINAIGVLTKVDAYWSDGHEPLQKGRQVVNRLLNDHMQLRNLFYNIYPVYGLLAFGAQTMDDKEYQSLLQLTALSEEQLLKILKNGTKFTTKEDPELPVPPGERKKLWNRLGQYGIWLAYQFIRQGITNPKDLAAELMKHSGVSELRDLVVSHFGNRAFLIKLSSSIKQLQAKCFQEKQRLQGPELEAVLEIAGRMEALEAQEHSYKEFVVLRSYYEKKLDFNPQEVQHLLEVTGEYGISLAKRLGLDERANVEEMMPVVEARKHYWRLKANDQFSSNSDTNTAANVIAQSYERIYYHLLEVRKHMYL